MRRLILILPIILAGCSKEVPIDYRKIEISCNSNSGYKFYKFGGTYSHCSYGATHCSCMSNLDYCFKKCEDMNSSVGRTINNNGGCLDSCLSALN